MQSYLLLFPWPIRSPSFALCSLASCWVKSLEANVSDSFSYTSLLFFCPALTDTHEDTSGMLQASDIGFWNMFGELTYVIIK